MDEFFAPQPRTLEEFKARERRAYVNREDLIKAHARLANDAALDGELLRDLRRLLSMGYYSCVHGGYVTAMELYDGSKRRFLVDGSRWERRLCIGRVGVAGKLHEVLTALESMALLQRDVSLHDEIRDARRDLEAADEQSDRGCSPLAV